MKRLPFSRGTMPTGSRRRRGGNPGAGVIGLSNVFDGSDDLASAYRDAAGAAQALWGPAPVVGYESGAERGAARQAGFVSTASWPWVGPAELPTGR